MAQHGRPGQSALLAWRHAVVTSLNNSIGDIVFGMEDGTVSIFGLVFGVAASASNDKVVLLAGATGAIAAAVSMMAGAYLDATSARSVAQVRIAHEHQEVRDDPATELKETSNWLRRVGLSRPEIESFLPALQQHPEALTKLQIATELGGASAAQENPYAHAAWMFVSDLIAAFTPVLPFAFLPLDTARIVSIIVTTLLLLGVGIGRGLVANRNIWFTALETLGIAAAAALAGYFIGKWITTSLG